LEIIIKDISNAKRRQLRIDAEEYTVENICTVLFDVIDKDRYWIDPEGKGFFPLELAIPDDAKETEIKDRCIQWIQDNDILSKYIPVDSVFLSLKQTVADAYSGNLLKLASIKKGKLDTVDKCEVAIKDLHDIVYDLLRLIKSQIKGV
jgi:hypothetical protein